MNRRKEDEKLDFSFLKKQPKYQILLNGCLGLIGITGKEKGLFSISNLFCKQVPLVKDIFIEKGAVPTFLDVKLDKEVIKVDGDNDKLTLSGFHDYCDLVFDKISVLLLVFCYFMYESQGAASEEIKNHLNGRFEKQKKNEL